MEETADKVYLDLMRQLAAPGTSSPVLLADTFREVERMHSMARITDWQLHNAREAYARTTGSRIGDAANWALDKSKNALHAAAGQVRERTTTAVTTYTQADPLRAVLIAAAIGAVVMGLVAMVAQSGARKVRRKLRSARL